MWGKSINRRNIALVALTTASVALGVAGSAQAQTAKPDPVPTRAESIEMLRNRLERLKDPAGNYPQDDSTARCVRTATTAGRRCSVTIEYPEMRCTDSSVMTSFLITSTGARKPVITGLKLRCVRTIDLTDDEETTQAPAQPPIAVPTPVEEPAPAAEAATPAREATPEDLRAAERERIRQIEAGLIPA